MATTATCTVFGELHGHQQQHLTATQHTALNKTVPLDLLPLQLAHCHIKRTKMILRSCWEKLAPL
jgi:hypothetical protein